MARALACWLLLIALLAGAACSSTVASTWVLIDSNTWKICEQTDAGQAQSWNRPRPALTGSAYLDEMNNAYLWRSSSHGVRHGYRTDESMTPVATIYGDDESHSLLFDGANDLWRAGYGWLAVRYGDLDTERPWRLWQTSTRHFAPLSLPDQGLDLGQGWLAVTTDGFVAAIRDLRLSLYTIDGDKLPVPKIFDDARIVGVTPVLRGRAILVQAEPDTLDSESTGAYVWLPAKQSVTRVSKESRPSVHGQDQSILFVPSEVWLRPHRLVTLRMDEERSEITTRAWGPRAKDISSVSPDLAYAIYSAQADWIGKVRERRLLRLKANGKLDKRLGALPDGLWIWFNTAWEAPHTTETIEPPHELP